MEIVEIIFFGNKQHVNMEKEYYRIIDIEEISNIYHWERAILVKANKANVQEKNGKPFGLSFATKESSTTDWFVFKYSTRKLARLLEAARLCDNNELWGVEKHIFTPLPIPIFDGGRSFTKMVFFTIMWDDEFDYTDIHEGVFKPQTNGNEYEEDDEDDDSAWYDGLDL